MFRSRLEAEGVPAVVTHEHHIWNAWHYSTALGGVKVQVYVDRNEQATDIAKRCSDGESREVLENHFGATDEIHCPNCGSHDNGKRRPIPCAAIAVAFSFMTGVVIPPAGWIYFCDRCDAKFSQVWLTLDNSKLATILQASACGIALFLAGLLCFWSIGTRYWFITAVVAVLVTGRWITHRESSEPPE